MTNTSQSPFALDAGSAFPLGPPPTVAPVSKGDNPRAASRPRGGGDRLLVGLLATTALLLGAIVVLLLVFEAPPAGSATGPVATALVQAPPASSRPVEPRPDRALEAERDAGDPIADATAESAARALPSTGARVAPGPTVRPPPTRPSSTPTAPSVTANGKPRTPSCPCPPDDLMCNMRCSVGK
jgi:hypothetical protein